MFDFSHKILILYNRSLKFTNLPFKAVQHYVLSIKKLLGCRLYFYNLVGGLSVICYRDLGFDLIGSSVHTSQNKEYSKYYQDYNAKNH